MRRSLRHGVVGRDQTWYRRALWSAVAVLLFASTFAAYTYDVFTISGGVVFIPGDAALVGIVAAAVVGYAHDGLVVAWLVTFGSLLGYRAYHAFIGLPSRSFPEQLGYFLHPEGLFVFAVEGIVLGSLPFIVGLLVRWGVEATLADAGPRTIER